VDGTDRNLSRRQQFSENQRGFGYIGIETISRIATALDEAALLAKAPETRASWGDKRRA
jgi:hypothetical protein